MRWSFVLCLAACAAPQAHPAPRRPPVAVVTASPTVLEPPETGEPPATGVIEHRPFVARSALMLWENVPGRNCPWPGWISGCSVPTGHSSFIRIYDRVVTCAEARVTDTGIREVPLRDDEYSVFVQLEGAWPLPPGTRTVGHIEYPADHLYVTYDKGDNGLAGLDGTVEIVRATKNQGVLWFDVAKKNPFSRETFSGTVGFTVCR